MRTLHMAIAVIIHSFDRTLHSATLHKPLTLALQEGREVDDYEKAGAQCAPYIWLSQSLFIPLIAPYIVPPDI